MVKNLAVFFDGTWNEPNDRTNVYELYKAAPETSTQETLYIEGVGTQGRGLWAALDKVHGRRLRRRAVGQHPPRLPLALPAP